MEEYPDSYYVANSTFDVKDQYFQLMYPDGITPFMASLDEVGKLQRLAVQTGMIFGFQIGVCTILMLILGLLTRSEKRRSPVFILNMSALVCLFIRAVLMCLNTLGPFFSFYIYTIGYYDNVKAAQRINVVCEVFGFLTTVAVELSMVFQVDVVCCTMRGIWRRAVLIVCLSVALLVCGFRFAVMVLNADYNIVNVESLTEEKFLLVDYYASAANISTLTSIIFFSVIFCAKLGHAIHHRRKMGMKQFGPMQIIFVMGCQTLFIPAIFGIVVYFALYSTQLASIMPLVVATFLPLSSMWASANPSNINIAAVRKPVAYKPSMITGSSFDSNQDEKKHLNSAFSPQGTLVNETDEEAYDPKRLGAHAHASVARDRRDSIDVELAKMKHGVVVDRSYSVRNNSG